MKESLKVQNKVAILISWPREFDMFSVITNNINKDLLVVIIDDFVYEEYERQGNVKNLLHLINNVNYVLLSDVIGKYKYKYLFSTAQTFRENITALSFIKYLYGRSIGRVVEASKIYKFFLFLFNRPLTGNAGKVKKFEIEQIERLVGVKTIRFPKGLDLSLKSYPVGRWEKSFDMHLCHSNIDYDLITDNFPSAECVKIGYPRYENIVSPYEAKKIIYKEFSDLDESKPTIVWIPAHIKIKSELGNNVKLWLPIINKLTANYNVIVRPHPKTRIVCPNTINDIIKSDLIVDLEFDREMSILYQASDLVLADYGGSVFDSIYMKRNIILLNMPHKSKFYKWRKYGEYLDNYVRNDATFVEYNSNINLIKKIDHSLSNSKDSALSSLKNKFFKEDNNYKNIFDIIREIENEINKT
jgi:hypothetical protein